MGEKALNKAFEYIDAMAAKLGVASEHVYGLLVKQQVINGITLLIASAILGAVFVTILIAAVKAIKHSEWDRYRPINNYARYANLAGGEMFWVINIGGVISAIIALPLLISGIRHLYNPEYYAIKEILKTIGGG